MNWISVKDQLPLIQKTVLFTDNKEIFLGNCVNDEELNHYWLHGEWKISDVTHWMELPALPEKKQNEWINVKDDLPSPFEVVWIYWRDREVLLGCRVYVGKDAVECDRTEGWHSFEDEKCRWTHFWQRVDSYNFDKPSKPKKLE